MTDQQYFHGGIGGLRIGALILPPTITGAVRADKYARYPAGVYRPDRVYIITELDEARWFAAVHSSSGTPARGGDVYRVEPEGDLLPDPDSKRPGVSWSCPRARIVGIVATSVKRGPYLDALKAGAARANRWVK